MTDKPKEKICLQEFAQTRVEEYCKHAGNFWNIIECRFADRQKREMKLFGYWFLIQSKLRGITNVI